MLNIGKTSIFSFVIFVLIVNEIQATFYSQLFQQRPRSRFQDAYMTDYSARRIAAATRNHLGFNEDRENYKFLSRRASPEPMKGLDPNIKWDKMWGSGLNLGQVSAVSIDPDGNVAIFHRGTRVWDYGSFDQNDIFNLKDNAGAIKENTIILLDKKGHPIIYWGRDTFYMPHGLTIDHLGNYWITDVAMHQVFKFDAEDIKKNKMLLTSNTGSHINVEQFPNVNDLFKNSVIKPSLILGTAFSPGNDEESFCKPTSVAVMKNGDFFVADGYCNSRIIKFNSKGVRILTWGRSTMMFGMNPPHNSFNVPHALALAEEFDYLFMADRENGRVLCFHATNGSFHKEYKNNRIGGAIYSIDYAQEKLFLVNGPDSNETVIRGFIMDINTNKILSEFAPNGPMARPHDIAVTRDGLEIYVVELDEKRVTRFVQGRNSSSNQLKSSDLLASGTSVPDFKSAPLTDVGVKTSEKSTSFVFSLIVSMVILIVLCLILAVVVSRWKKRGCLLTSRRRSEWNPERKDNFKLSNLLENRTGRKFKFFEKRPNTRDFSKLNTEPETSDDEHPEDKLTKII